MTQNAHPLISMIPTVCFVLSPESRFGGPLDLGLAVKTYDPADGSWLHTEQGWVPIFDHNDDWLLLPVPGPNTEAQVLRTLLGQSRSL